MKSLDLTDFGFTPTESQAYLALLNAGPSSGYAIAKQISVARANAYQALNGLVAKAAAVEVDRKPRIFRAVAPAALLAHITREQAARLDRLERAVAEVGQSGEPAILPFRGNAELEALALRTAVRAQVVRAFGPPAMLRSLAPIWRARAANDRPTTLYVVGDPASPLPFPIQASIADRLVAELFGTAVGALLTEDAGIIVQLESDEPAGLWFSHPLLTGTLRTALSAMVP